jgi:REP element-mobilizing transposase RayT
MARSIKPLRVFHAKKYKEDFLDRLETVVETDKIVVYAWALLPNHFHLLLRSGPKPLSGAMRKVMTGFAVSYNLRRSRHGHVFQNRYKSIVCEEELYLLELVRYIHLNPLRARMVRSLEELNTYPWSGHSTLMGTVERPWQDTDEVLKRFGGSVSTARESYLRFVTDGVDEGERPDLTGGGLIRSAGGWSEVLAMRQKKQRMASDDRILGSGEFVEQVLRQAEEQEAQTLRLKRAGISFEDVVSEVAQRHSVEVEELLSGSRRRAIGEARRDVARIAVKKLGMSGAEVARRMGVSTACISRIVGKEAMSQTAQEIIAKLRT